MEKKTLYIVLGVVGGVLVLCCGCGGIVGYFGWQGIKAAGADSKRINDLKQVSLAAHSYNDAMRKMPANADDLAPYLENGPVVTRIRNGEINVIWNALPPQQQTAGSSNVIYAWDTKAGASGKRLVVYMDGFANQITEAEFQQKPKAATTLKKSN